MDSGNKRHRIGYKIIFPVAVLISGLVLGLILRVVGFEVNSRKAGDGIGLLLLFAVAAGVLADMKNQKACHDLNKETRKCDIDGYG